MANKVLFSIITPTYNRAKTGLLAECITSVRKQKSGNYLYEHIIINDGSTDGTANFLEELAKKDKRIRVITQENGGTSEALKAGIRVANGNYIVFLDDDDAMPSDSLAIRAKYILDNPSVDWFYGKTQWVDDKLKPIKTWTQSENPPGHHYERGLVSNIVQGGTATFKKDIIAAIEWPTWLKKSNDYFIILEILRPEHDYKFGFIDKVLYRYRWHNRGIGRQSQRSLKTAKSAKIRWELDNRIRRLHPASLAFLTTWCNELLRENAKLKWDIEKLELYKKRYLENEKQIQDIQKSKGWKLIQLIRKISGANREK